MSSIASLAVSADAQPAPAAAPSQPQVAAPELICRRMEETGSLVKKKKKVCYTRQEWDQIAAQSRNAMNEGQMTGGQSGQ